MPDEWLFAHLADLLSYKAHSGIIRRHVDSNKRSSLIRDHLVEAYAQQLAMDDRLVIGLWYVSHISEQFTCVLTTWHQCAMTIRLP